MEVSGKLRLKDVQDRKHFNENLLPEIRRRSYINFHFFSV